MSSLNRAELGMLLARLKWPLPSVRWWAIQEIAGLLTSDAFRNQVEETLMDELSRARFETEIVELLNIFLIAGDGGYSVPNTLGASIGARSPLSSLLLRELGYGGASYGLVSSPLFLAPPYFTPTDDFLEAQGSEVPRMFQSLLGRLENHTGHPYVSQYAFEWASSLGRIPAIGQDVSHFFPAEREGATGQFVTQASNRGRSAYLRVLAIAEKYWNLPADTCDEFSLAALPIDPTLANLHPTRPAWLVQWPQEQTPDAESLSEYVRELASRCEREAGGGMVLGAFSAPIHQSELERLDLTITLWADFGDAEIDTEYLAAMQPHEEGVGVIHVDGLSRVGQCEADNLDASVTDAFSAAPISGRMRIVRYGYLNSDITSRGIYAPLRTNSGAPVQVTPSGQFLEYSVNAVKLGTGGIWNVAWHPCHPREAGPQCGSYLALIKSQLPLLLTDVPKKVLYYWELKKLSRKQAYSPYVGETLAGVVRAG